MTSSFYLSPTVTGSRAATPVHNATLSQMSIPTARRGAGEHQCTSEHLWYNFYVPLNLWSSTKGHLEMSGNIFDYHSWSAG